MSEATLGNAELRSGLRTIATAWIDHADEFNALDAATGDGDMGVSARTGAKAVIERVDGIAADATPAVVLREAGMAFNEAAGSTIGALVATAGLRAAAALGDAESVDLAGLGEALDAAAAGIGERGKSKVGDKTLLDALVPAVAEIRAAAAAGKSFDEAGERAREAAREGVEATASMEASVGRGKWAPGKGSGSGDAGATAVYVALDALL